MMMIAVFGIAVSITFMLMGIIHYNTEYTINEQKKNVDVYLQDCQDRVEKWYERNAASKDLTLLSFSSPDAVTNGVSAPILESKVMQEADIKRKYNLRILISDVFDSELKNTGTEFEHIADSLTEQYHRNIRYRKLYCIITNPESSDQINLGAIDTPISVSGITWTPSNPGRIPLSILGNNPSAVDTVMSTTDKMTLYIDEDKREFIKFAVIDGLTIQKKKIGETISYLTVLSKLMEARFKAKLDTDPFHNIGWNHFRPGETVIPDADIMNVPYDSSLTTINVSAVAKEDEFPETVRCACREDAMAGHFECDKNPPYARDVATIFDGRWSLSGGNLLNDTYRPLGFVELESEWVCGPSWKNTSFIKDGIVRLFGGAFPTRDSWGNPLMFSNKIGPDPIRLAEQGIADARYSGSGATSNPPYSIPVIAMTPWGTLLVVNAIQPVN